MASSKKAKTPTKQKKTPSPEDTKLGKLSCLGPKQPWQVALLLPSSWKDYRSIHSTYHPLRQLSAGAWIVVRGVVKGEPSTRFNAKVARTTVRLLGQCGQTIGFTMFGETRHLKPFLKPGRVICVSGKVGAFNGDLWLNEPELVFPQWQGKLCPVYPGKTRLISPPTVRDGVLEHLDEAIPIAARWIVDNALASARAIGVKIEPDVDKITHLLRAAHMPGEPSHGEKAQGRLEMLAAIATMGKVHGGRVARGNTATPLNLGGWRRLESGVPFPLTGEQRAAVEAIVEDFRSPMPRHHLLSGDVGTGKTVVFGLVAAANAFQGNVTAVMLPNQALAGQAAREMKGMWPTLPLELITGDSRKGALELPQGGVVVGTTALLTRMDEDMSRRVTLVVVDEQQKFSVAQREQLTKHGAHLLEVTATCIPRTLALARYGAIKVSRLTLPHTPKNIVSRIYHQDQKGDLFKEIRASLARRDQVLIVYPLKDSEKGAESNERLAVEQAAGMWELAFPGMVRKIHGAMDDAEKSAALQDLREDRAEILIGTTVVEVGINLPRLRHVVVVDPGRLGLTQLHQIRGRAARNGGEGRFDMYLPTPPAPHTLERLSVLTRTQDGFKVAEDDLRLRGFGDLGEGSAKQTGADETFLFGRPIRVEIMDQVAKIIDERLRAAGT